MRLAKRRNLVIQKSPKQKLDQLSIHENHQGVVLTVAAFKYATIDDLFENAKQKEEDPFFLILDNLEDPHNLGSIMRRRMPLVRTELLFRNAGRLA